MNTLRVSSMILVVVVFLVASHGQPALAAWSTNPSENTPVCDLSDNQDNPQMVSDGAGGMIIVWRDVRLSGWSFTYAQRLDVSGNEVWQTYGVMVCPMEGNQMFPALVSDGAGGAVITWLDYRSDTHEVYAQRLDSDGNQLWALEGVPICSNPTGDPWNPQITTDGAGGAIIAWMDSRNGSTWDIYAQRVDLDGNILWTANGEAVCTAAGNQYGPKLVSDDAGGAIMAWEDSRSGLFDIYVQRMDGMGSPLWDANGESLGTATDEEADPCLVADGAGGAVISWEDDRFGGLDIFAQHLDASGSELWTSGGMPVCSATGYQTDSWLVEDGSGGTIIAWNDSRSGSDADIYAQRIDPTGSALWTMDGIAVCTAAGNQYDPLLVSDGTGGAIIAWEDFRSGTNYDIYAQKVDTWGDVLWPATGVAVSMAASHQLDPVLLSDGDGGVFISWDDQRSGTDYDVYAQQVDWNGRRAGAVWSHDPLENNAVCTGDYDPAMIQTISDGNKGMIAVWKNYEPVGVSEMFAQRLDVNGSAVWAKDGTAICAATTGGQSDIQMVSDGAGGGIITWADYRSAGGSDIYAQRVDGTGRVLWAVNGVAICTYAFVQNNPQLTGDGAGGVIIAWDDGRDATGGWSDIYAQRVDASGNVLWAADGVPLIITDHPWDYHKLVTDGAGGAIVTWSEYDAGDNNIFAQRIDGSGNTLWTPGNIVICDASGEQENPELVSDDAGGAIIAWSDGRAADIDIYAQRVDASGNTLWESNGRPICTAINNQTEYKLASNGAGGAIVVWTDNRSGGWDTDIYAQHVVSVGYIHWALDGIVISDTTRGQSEPDVVSDHAGGAFIVWDDSRNGIYKDIYAQHVDAAGSQLWHSDGVAVCTAAGNQGYPLLVTDGAGGVIMVWDDIRSGDSDIYAQRIGPNGYLGNPAPTIKGIIDHPEDQGGVTVLSWETSAYDEFPGQVVTNYSIWKRLPEDLDRAGWTYVDDIPATYQIEYGFDAPTYEDYTGGPDFPLTEYKVIAHTLDPWIFWESSVRSSCSVDNLAPGAPLTLLGLPDESDVLLTWEASGHLDEDLAHYNVYRGTTPGFTVDEHSLIGTITDIEYTDPNPGYGTWYYRVAGEDVHGNVGSPSNEASVPVSTSTVSATLTCAPSSGVLPFVTGFNVQLLNQYQGQIRRIAGRIHVTLANGTFYSNWRAGSTNVQPGSTYATSWNQPIPALAPLVGDNLFRLVAADVTPAPYNQPPYPPAGDTDSDTATVTGIAP